MNSPNPFVPQGSLLELQSKRRSRLKVAVFCILAVGVTGLTAMLIQGCKREQNEAENQLPPIETNETANTNLPAPMEASNPPATPPPVVTPPVAPAPAPSETEYVVIKGDSLWKIAKKNGVTLKALEEANPGVDAAKLKVGQKLTIPAASNASEATTGMTGSTGAGGGEEIYIVKSGDTLARIARRNGTTVKAIESENGLSTTRIKVGQKLKIPAKEEAAPAPAAASAPEPAPAAAPDTTSAPDNTPNPQQ
jgi:LysM repeat protein